MKNNQMDFRKHSNWIKLELPKLFYEQQLLFGYLGAKRLLPNYYFFYRKEKWGNPNFLHMMLDKVEYIIWGKDPIDLDVKNSLQYVNEIMPDMEDFESTIYASPALDSSASVACLLRFLVERDIDNIIDIANYCVTTVDMYISQMLDLNYYQPDYYQKINNHQFMLRELNLQKNQYNTIIQSKSVSQELIQLLKAMQDYEGYSSINLK